MRHLDVHEENAVLRGLGVLLGWLLAHLGKLEELVRQGQSGIIPPGHVDGEVRDGKHPGGAVRLDQNLEAPMDIAVQPRPRGHGNRDDVHGPNPVQGEGPEAPMARELDHKLVAHVRLIPSVYGGRVGLEHALR